MEKNHFLSHNISCLFLEVNILSLWSRCFQGHFRRRWVASGVGMLSIWYVIFWGFFSPIFSYNVDFRPTQTLNLKEFTPYVDEQIVYFCSTQRLNSHYVNHKSTVIYQYSRWTNYGCTLICFTPYRYSIYSSCVYQLCNIFLKVFAIVFLQLILLVTSHHSAYWHQQAVCLVKTSSIS